jgi:hypothetical protein
MKLHFSSFFHSIQLHKMERVEHFERLPELTKRRHHLIKNHAHFFAGKRYYHILKKRAAFCGDSPLK